MHHPPIAALFVAFTAITALLPAQARRGELDEAKQLLQSGQEGEVTQGGKLCVQANNVAAVELLLDVLAQTDRATSGHLPPGHYRDIVWDALTRITDQYARARVAHELKTGRDQRVRQWCAELLGIYGDRGFGDTLRSALSARDDDLQRWAARSLGMLKFEAAQPELVTLSRAKNDYVRANAIEALARIDGKNLAVFVAAIGGDASGGVRCALLGAAAEVCGEQCEELSAKALQDRDWRPRMQAVQNLGQIKTKSAVDALLLALHDGRPVVAARALRELQQLTGQPIEQVEVWEKWWADNRASFAFPDKRGVPARQQGATVVYNGLPIESDHIAFLLDKSVAMGQQLKSKNMVKDQAAQQELQRVLELLDGKITFNVFNYAVEVEACTRKPVKLTPQSRKKALDFAKAAASGREKDIWQALSTVVDDGTLDTVYLLSSGEPDTGLYVHYNRVTRHLADLDRFHKVVVHTVAYTDNEWFRDQLKRIAEVTGGSFQWFQ